MSEFAIARPQDMEQVFDLRYRVLRQPIGQRRGSERDPCDDHDLYPDTVHGLIIVNGLVVATGRIHQDPDNPLELQVHHMAVDESSRGRGLGTKVLRGMEPLAVERFPEARTLVLSAREPAISMYRRSGYSPVTGEIYSPSSLPGVRSMKMHKTVPARVAL